MKLNRAGALTLCLAAGAALAGFLFVREQRRAGELESSLAGARQQLQAAEGERARIEEENRRLHDQIVAEGLQPAAPAPAVRTGDGNRLEAVRELSALQTRHDALQQQFGALQNRMAEVEGALEKLTAENRRLSAAESSLNDQLESNKRVVAAMDAELKSKTVRVDQLEASLRRLRDQTSGAERRSGQITQGLRQLEEINRRREDTLNALQRRYRDVTDQLRSLALRLDTQRDSPAALGATDLSRIASAVQSAEEDLRQLTSLNTQARNVIERLAP